MAAKVKMKHLSVLDMNADQTYLLPRFAEFLEYSRDVSLSSILQSGLLVYLCPLGMLCLLISLPVAQIDQGLTGFNWFQILYLYGGCLVGGIMVSFKYRALVDQSILTPVQLLIAASALPISACIAITTIELTVVYPVPFTLIVAAAIGVVFQCVAFIAIEGQNFYKIRYQFFAVVVAVTIAVSSMLLHESIGVLYTKAKGNVGMQFLIACCLPMLKFLAQRIVCWYFKERGDGYSISIIAFEIKFFNMLYTSLFIQTSTNALVSAGLVSFDLVENLYFLYRMNTLASKLKTRGSSTQGMMRNLLFRTEMVVLVECVEVITPLLYGNYLLVLRQLPNLKYYPAIANLSDEEFNQSIYKLLILDAIELAGLLCLILTLKIRFKLPLIAQIGFALKKNRGLNLSTMTLWFGIALSIPFTHMGSDYSFQFSEPDFKYL